MGHRLSLATKTQISACKSPFLSAGIAVSLFRVKTVQQRPLLPREVETWLPDCGVASPVTTSYILTNFHTISWYKKSHNSNPRASTHPWSLSAKLVPGWERVKRRSVPTYRKEQCIRGMFMIVHYINKQVYFLKKPKNATFILIIDYVVTLAFSNNIHL